MLAGGHVSHSARDEVEQGTKVGPGQGGQENAVGQGSENAQSRAEQKAKGAASREAIIPSLTRIMLLQPVPMDEDAKEGKEAKEEDEQLVAVSEVNFMPLVVETVARADLCALPRTQHLLPSLHAPAPPKMDVREGGAEWTVSFRDLDATYNKPTDSPILTMAGVEWQVGSWLRAFSPPTQQILQPVHRAEAVAFALQLRLYAGGCGDPQKQDESSQWVSVFLRAADSKAR